MFYGSAQSIVAFVRNLLAISIGFYKTFFILNHYLTRPNMFLIRVFGIVMIILIIGIQILRLFCVACEICTE